MEKKQLKSFKDLSVWQKAVDLAALVYSITEKFPKSELYGITNQMRRSAVSISSNIAEGFKRSHGKEKLQFYNIAYGSIAELDSQIEVSRRLNFLHNDDYQRLNAAVTEIGKMIDGLIKSQNKPPKSYLLNPIFFFILLYSIFYILYPNPIFAAQLNFVSQTKEIAVGQQFQVDIILNTEGEEINAVEGKIVFPAGLLEPKEIRDGNSIINFWIEKPSLNSKSYILYSGITPGGFQGNNGLLFSAVFEAKKEGGGLIEIQNAKTLLNDGKGTEASLTISNLPFNILDVRRPDIRDVGRPEIEDTEPPESFVPEIARDPAIFEGKWFLVFATQDKGSGIAYYAIRETRRKINIERKTDAKWTEAESPYVLQDQELRSYVFVKAVDKVGNERIVVVEPRYPIKWYEQPLIWIIIILGIVMILTAWRIIRKFLSSKS